MAKRTREGADAVYAAADMWRVRCLAESGSLFTPGTELWQPAFFAELDELFIRNPDLGDRSFMVKLADQLQGASDGAIQLMAELLYVHLLVTVTVGQAKKAEIVEQVLGLLDSPPLIDEGLEAAYHSGLVNPGTFFSTRRDLVIRYLIRFGSAWTDLRQTERQQLLKDPWAFREMVYGVEVESAFTQRNAILHLVHPDVFEAVVSDSHKAQLTERLAEYVTDRGANVDRQLLEIREALDPGGSLHLDFYSDDVKPRWFGPPGDWKSFIQWASKFFELAAYEASERTYKIEIAERLQEARAAVLGGRDDWQDLLRRGLQKDNNLTPWQVHGSFNDWVVDNPDEGLAALEVIWAPGSPTPDRIASFLERLPTSVVSGKGSRLALASLLLMSMDPNTFPVYRKRPFARAYDLLGMTKPGTKLEEKAVYESALVLLDQLIDEASGRGLELRDRLDAQSLLWMVTKWDPPDSWSTEDRREFLKWRGDPEPEPIGENWKKPAPVGLQALADSIYMPAEFLERSIKLLTEKGQAIFYGPPGTGKTYVARMLATHLAGEDGDTELVQFHPSYAYEDFVEGFRPATDGGFRLRPGPLRRIAEKAMNNPEATFVLVIDELNRGNLAKVFGELYFLLEYRSSEISLQYSDAPFRLPKNLLVIGTMNTADRSIALVDGALRRRFYFVPFFPDAEPVDGLLARWLEDGHPEMAWVGDLLDEANVRLNDRHVAIGPSHFMREDLDDEWVELIWMHSVLPYVEEQLFGEEHRLKDFELHAIRAHLESARRSATEAEEDSDGTSEDQAT